MMRYAQGNEQTYNVLMFFGVVGHLGDCDCAADIFIVLGFT